MGGPDTPVWRQTRVSGPPQTKVSGPREKIMQLGFVSAILSEWSFEDVLKFAADEGFACVEPMCWPKGGADRRYAGVTHIDVTNFGDDEAGRLRDLVRQHGVVISGLGYYPNPLDPNPEHRRVV